MSRQNISPSSVCYIHKIKPPLLSLSPKVILEKIHLNYYVIFNNLYSCLETLLAILIYKDNSEDMDQSERPKVLH